MDIPRIGRTHNLDHAAAMVEAALQAKLVKSYAALVGATDEAVDTLRSIMLTSRHDEARVAAAREILDRANLTPDVRIVVSAGNAERATRIEELNKQLNSMQAGIIAPIDTTSTDETEDTA